MAKKIVETLLDDIDGNEANETVSFALDGTSYEIDLHDTHAAKLRDVLAPFVKAGRRATASHVVTTSSRRRKGSSTIDRQQSRAIRLWAKANGISVSERGRIGGDVVAKYEAAH